MSFQHIFYFFFFFVLFPFNFTFHSSIAIGFQKTTTAFSGSNFTSFSRSVFFFFQLQDEKELLEKKIVHLEKKKRQLLDEQDELQEQISHSQEIIEKLSDAEEVLKDRLQKEIKEKEYLQECLEETGQILFQLKINEKKLLEDKHELQYELENEAEVSSLR